MPLYDYRCTTCKITEEMVTPIIHNQACPRCGREMKRLMSAPHINMGPVGAYGYFDENLGKYIGTNTQRREEMRRQGVTEKGATPKEGQAWV